MDISRVYRVRPKLYRYSIDGGLSFQVAGITQKADLVSNLYMNSGTYYPVSPSIFLIPVNGVLLIAISGSVDSVITFNREYAFNDVDLVPYDSLVMTVNSETNTIFLVDNFYSGYWRFSVSSDTDGYFTVSFRAFNRELTSFQLIATEGLITIGTGITVGAGITIG